MAKKSVRTNAFGMTPDSFDTTKRQETEVNVTNVTADIPAPVTEPKAPVQAAPAEKTNNGKREYKIIGKDNVRVHFLEKVSFLERIDACADRKGTDRTSIIKEAIRLYLEQEGM